MSARLRVGITGGIGSGKSALTDRLSERGIHIVDADVVAREVVEPGSEALALIAEHFGETGINADGSLDRAALRQIVFAEPSEREWLEAVTHPRIAERIARELDDAVSPYVVLSSPLLLEGSQRDFVDHVVVVDVPQEIQIARTAARDSNSEALVKSIMAAQLPREARLAGADRVIDNSGSLEELERQADTLHRELLAMADRHSRN